MFRKIKTKKVYEYPCDMKELGYCINKKGQLCTLEGINKKYTQLLILEFKDEKKFSFD